MLSPQAIDRDTLHTFNNRLELIGLKHGLTDFTWMHF